MFNLKNIHYTIALVTLFACTQVAAHATPEQTIPGAGAELKQAPTTVSIRFDDELEPVFSKLIVKDAQDKQVSQGNGELDSANSKIICTELDALQPGQYHVYWRVVSRDGHHTHGDYTFTVE